MIYIYISVSIRLHSVIDLYLLSNVFILIYYIYLVIIYTCLMFLKTKQKKSSIELVS